MPTEEERIRYVRNKRDSQERIKTATGKLLVAIERIHAESFPGCGLSALEWITVIGDASRRWAESKLKYEWALQVDSLEVPAPTEPERSQDD